ncbi:carboxypeptidase-like regulatory domain-containing protein [Planctomycetes bacterium Poly30]|uniref:carboxypeptidase-like regulatory domain-containing protein n=1 Tax=Saltatorellus ferox TaxID=2528018 RepID=UPI0011AA0B23
MADGTGAFEIALGGGENSVHAVLPGFVSARAEKGPDGVWPEELVLVLGPRALEIRGRVVDETGAPLAGMHVGVLDGEAFGAVGELGSGTSRMKRVEDMASAAGTATYTTSKDGAFRIDGLQSRAYRVLAHEPDRLWGTEVSVEAGQSAVEIVIDREQGSGRLRGRVTDQRGDPLRDVVVHASRAFGAEEDHYNREANELHGASARTDELGVFSFPSMALLDVQLRAYRGLEFQVYHRALSDFEDPAEVDIQLTRNAEFRIEWSEGGPPGAALSMGLEVSDGSQALMYRRYGEGSIICLGEVILEGGSTPVLFAGEGSYEVVLLGENGEVDRFPLELTGEGIQTVHR